MDTVYVSEPIHPDALELLKGRCRVVRTRECWEKVDAVILRAETLDRPAIEAAKRLKVIGRHGVGLDNVDLAAAKEFGIPVVYTPEANADSVAELIVALMLCGARKVVEAAVQMKQGGYTQMGPASIRGVELRGKSVGLIGFGRVARLTAGILSNGFGAKITAYDPYADEKAFQVLGAARASSIRQCVSDADLVSLSIPLTAETRGSIGRETFAACKRGCIFINCSRGGIVDESALLDALTDGPLAFAASDVFADEKNVGACPLLQLDNFIGLPHMGANTQEAMRRMAMTVAEDVLAVLSGRHPQYQYKG